MSYPKDLDEYTDVEIRAEIRRRARAALEGRCSYCHQALDAKPCRYGELHKPTPEGELPLWVVTEIIAEYRQARRRFGPFHSRHEGYAVLLEEVDELWEAIRVKGHTDAQVAMEARQVAAMAAAFMCECVPMPTSVGPPDRRVPTPQLEEWALDHPRPQA